MLQKIINQVPVENITDEGYHFPINEVGVIFGGLALAYGGIETYRRTCTKVNQIPIRSYFDDNTFTRVVEMKIEIKYRDNPFFKRITLFEYEGNADYKISGYEFNTHQTKINRGFFYNWIEEERTKVMIIDKTHFKQRGISKMEVRIEHKDTEYRNKISEDINSKRIIVTNENDLPIINYLLSLPIQTDISRLKDDPRIYDLYEDGHLWIIKIKEVPAAGVNEPHRMTILI